MLRFCVFVVSLAPSAHGVPCAPFLNSVNSHVASALVMHMCWQPLFNLLAKWWAGLLFQWHPTCLKQARAICGCATLDVQLMSICMLHADDTKEFIKGLARIPAPGPVFASSFDPVCARCAYNGKIIIVEIASWLECCKAYHTRLLWPWHGRSLPRRVGVKIIKTSVFALLRFSLGGCAWALWEVAQLSTVMRAHSILDLAAMNCKHLQTCRQLQNSIGPEVARQWFLRATWTKGIWARVAWFWLFQAFFPCRRTSMCHNACVP